ncbi:MAG: peptidylprolyl isomerase [bacterium]
MRRWLMVLLCASLSVVGCGGKKSEAEHPNKGGKAAVDNEVALIQTRLGDIVLEFFPDVAPNHVANFKKLAKEGFYDGTTFHRVIPGFVIQGGDPNTKDDDRSNDGMGGPGYTVNAEFNQRQHLRGILSMARSQDPNSAGSQFFICVADIPHLDGKYTVFGQVIQGIEVVDQIVSLPRDPKDNPTEPVPMTKVSILPRSKIKSAKAK